MIIHLDPSLIIANQDTVGFPVSCLQPSLRAEVLETLRLIHLELAEAWEIHSARTTVQWEVRLKLKIDNI